MSRHAGMHLTWKVACARSGGCGALFALSHATFCTSAPEAGGGKTSCPALVACLGRGNQHRQAGSGMKWACGKRPAHIEVSGGAPPPQSVLVPGVLHGP
eukprot:366469-Chlamydomonas_euryale.AAC.1